MLSIIGSDVEEDALEEGELGNEEELPHPHVHIITGNGKTPRTILHVKLLHAHGSARVGNVYHFHAPTKGVPRPPPTELQVIQVCAFSIETCPTAHGRYGRHEDGRPRITDIEDLEHLTAPRPHVCIGTTDKECAGAKGSWNGCYTDRRARIRYVKNLERTVHLTHDIRILTLHEHTCIR